jgi:predicted lactoylglutathione lyase
MSALTASSIYINMPVKDVKKSIEFFSSLGFAFNPQMTGEDAACMIVNPGVSVMMLTHERFKGFAEQPVSDAHRDTEAIIILEVESRARVDEVAAKAKAGGAKVRNPDDQGFMYGHGFQDLDGHLWDVMYMDQAELAKMQAAQAKE